MTRSLMLVSERADTGLRAAVKDGLRPCPEYLHLERHFDVDLLDWSRLPGSIQRRGAWGSAIHVAAALRHARDFDVVFSDGEHLGLPLGMVLGARRLPIRHLMLAHHMTTPLKRRLWRSLRASPGITRILVHSRRQMDVMATDMHVPVSKLGFVPYFADTHFWSPGIREDEPIVAAAGREHRDYATLADACSRLRVRVVVAAGSFHSPSARYCLPETWPANFELVPTMDQLRLRELYNRASVVVVPLLQTDFQAGVTTLLEAMAMGKAVVVSSTRGQRDIVEDGITGLLVPTGDVQAMRDAVKSLLDNAHQRRRLGWNARNAVESRFSLEIYAAALARELDGLRPPAYPNARAANAC